MAYTIFYKTDSTDGHEFQKKSKEQGWVEYLNTMGNVYYFPQLSQQYYESARTRLIQNMPAYIMNKGRSDHLGWIHHLAKQRLLDKFTLPVFGSVDSSLSVHVQCGNSRIDACVMCGIGPEHIPAIVFCESSMRISAPAVHLKSTQQFSDIFKLDNIDYQIVFEESKSLEINFVNSVLRHTVYEGNPESSTHYSSSTLMCMDFWKKFQTESNQFKIEIHCTQKTQSQVVASDLFKIEYVIKDHSEWEFSYGMMLGAFDRQYRNPNVEHKLQLWLYDITEPVNIECLIPWMRSNRNFYKTQNNKAVVIDSKHKSNGLEVIGDWVQ